MMRQSSLHDTPCDLMTGRLEGISVPDLIWSLCRGERTGVLKVSQRGVTKKIYIQDGRIIFAASNDPDVRLGELLLREGIISLDHLEQAVSHLSSGKRLGTILVEAGHLTPENLVRGVLSQVRTIILSVFAWEEGGYGFEEGPLPSAELITLGMKTGEILLLGMRQIRSFTRIRRSVGPPRTCYRLIEDWRQLLEGLALNEGERSLIHQLESGGESIEALCRQVFLSNFEIYQSLWAFKVLGVLQEVERTGEVSRGFSEEGRITREGIGDTLVRLCRAGGTGLLHLRRGSLERTIHIKEGRCVFATSIDIDDGLVAHLLRRGVISLENREAAASRVLSNKRVGTILQEMGVLDDRDLRSMVQEQLAEVVADTFRWQDGEFVFMAGELPTLEEITLEMGIEDLVCAGLRRVTSWSRVREGCGGLTYRLRLTEDYLGVLDRMHVGAEEWEVVSLLREPRTVLEICRSTSLGDFRVCQIIWALRLLGALQPDDHQRMGTLPEAFDEEHMEGSVGSSIVAEDTSTQAPVAAGVGQPSVPPLVVEDAASAPPFSWSDPGGDRPVGSTPWSAPEDEMPMSVSRHENPVEAVVEDGPPLDSPQDATVFVSRGKDETAPGLARCHEGAPEFELDEPGGGVEDANAEPPEEQAASRTFELDAPAFEGSEPMEGEIIVPDLPTRLEAERSPALEIDVPAREKADSAPATPRILEDGSTVAIAREDVERALSGSVSSDVGENSWEKLEDAATPQPEPDWDPPEDLDRQITRFNAQHRLLYRTIRSEVGAGAANFVKSCRCHIPDGFGDLFTDADLRPDGTWEVDGLRKVILDRRLREPWNGFRQLLDQEIEMLRAQIGETRAHHLREQIEATAS